MAGGRGGGAPAFVGDGRGAGSGGGDPRAGEDTPDAVHARCGALWGVGGRAGGGDRGAPAPVGGARRGR
eukprot:5213990-Pleurochrysis_carterae.AAC.1